MLLRRKYGIFCLLTPFCALGVHVLLRVLDYSVSLGASQVKIFPRFEAFTIDAMLFCRNELELGHESRRLEHSFESESVFSEGVDGV